jgi:hypothetical protein
MSNERPGSCYDRFTCAIVDAFRVKDFSTGDLWSKFAPSAAPFPIDERLMSANNSAGESFSAYRFRAPDKLAVADTKKKLGPVLWLCRDLRLEAVLESLHRFPAARACVELPAGDGLEASAQTHGGGMPGIIVVGLVSSFLAHNAKCDTVSGVLEIYVFSLEAELVDLC